jgi:hypothetical protein
MRVRCLLLLCVIAVSASLAAASVDGNALTTSYAAPVLGAPVRISKLPLKIGNLTLDLGEGEVAPFLIGEDRVGLFFKGNGTFTYRTADPVERALVLFEAKKLDRTAEKGADGSVTIRGSFERLHVLSGGMELPAFAGEAGTGLADALRSHREAFGNVRLEPPSHLLVRQRLDEPSSPVAFVEMGGSDNNAYVLDTIETKQERFYALMSKNGLYDIKELRGALFPVRISDQPTGRERGAFVQPRFLLADLDYTLVAGEKAQGKLTVTETIIPRGKPQRVFRFNLRSGSWDDKWKYRPVRIDDLRDGAGNKLPFDFDEDSLLVGLPAAAPVDEPVILRFEISGEILLRPDNDSYWQLGTSAWFPQPNLNGQYYTIHSVVKVKKPWVAFATGDTVARREEGEFNVVENTLDKPLQFAVVHAGKYTIYEETFDGLTIRVAPYAGINDGQVKQLARLTQKIIKFYEPWLGPFPFKEFTIIEMNDYAWGQAPPGMMFITKEAFNPLIDLSSRYYSFGVNQRFAHEIAHQYWGIVVKMGNDEDQWITEAFSEFASSLVVKEIEGQSGYDSLVAHWRVNAKEAGDFAPIVLANRISIPKDPVKAAEHRQDLIYSKGAFALAVLRKQVGDPKFFSWMRNLQGQFAWRFMTTADAARLLDRIDTGRPHQPFFDHFISGTEVPQMPK